MANLTAKPPIATDPVVIGRVTLTPQPTGKIWSVAPFNGEAETLSRLLQTAHGLAFPGPGEVTEAGGVRCAWSGMDQAFLFGEAPDAGLADAAALTDQSDAWTHLVLEGADTLEVLARLVPIDLSLKECPVNWSGRSMLGHMSAILLHTGELRFELLVFRSMAETAMHDLTRAMRAVAARRAV